MNYVDYSTREDWLEARKLSIGGSDAAVIMGLSSYKTIQQLYFEKTGEPQPCLKKTSEAKPEDFKNSTQIQYGKDAEENIRELFRLDYPDYVVEHHEHRIYYSDKHSFLSASLDGEVYTGTNLKGILEIKTAEINSSLHHEQWKNKIPNTYYCQILHYLNVTGADFAHLRALLKLKYYSNPKTEIIDVVIERKDVEADIKLLEDEELRFWECVINRKPPTWSKLPTL